MDRGQGIIFGYNPNYRRAHLHRYRHFEDSSITGHETYILRGPRNRRPPLKESKNDPEAWSIDSQQILSGVINNVKGHFSDDQVREWYRRFKPAMLRREEESRSEAEINDKELRRIKE